MFGFRGNMAESDLDGSRSPRGEHFHSSITGNQNAGTFAPTATPTAGRPCRHE